MVYDILDWLVFTGVQITALPSDFYLGSALSGLVQSWQSPRDSDQRRRHRELVKRFVKAGADLHYKNKRQQTLLRSLVARSPVQGSLSKVH
jgi:hypothetical protein